MVKYNWCANEKKLERAEQALKQSNTPITEEAVKALYIKYGGLVLPTDENVNEEPVQTVRKPRVKKDE